MAEATKASEVPMRTVYRTCPLCEATCGLELTMRGDRVERTRGDRDDVFSHGFICPKGTTLGDLQDDPDRLRRPLIRRTRDGDEGGDAGTHVEVEWEEAFAEVERRLLPILEQHGRDAVAAYVGNPNVHGLAGTLFLRPLLKALGTRNLFSASTVDQMPKHVSSGWLFGAALSVPIPDIDRCHTLLMLGANPWESNGSLCTAPDFPGRLRALRKRGGRIIVIDPRRTRSAREADEHIAIQPGTDALLLCAILQVLFTEDRVDPGRVGEYLDGTDAIRNAVASFTPERVAPACRVEAATIRRLALELADSPAAAVYGRIGTHTVEFGTLAAWAVDAIHVLTGNLDRPGGAMFPLPAHAQKRAGPGGRGFSTGRWASRVRGLPEANGELPVATLSDEIVTEGEGQVRALVDGRGTSPTVPRGACSRSGAPTISAPSSPASVFAVTRSATLRPERSTTTWSVTDSTSRSLWLISTTARPAPRSRRTTVNSSSTSPGERLAVGSSRTRILTSGADRAFTISTR